MSDFRQLYCHYSTTKEAVSRLALNITMKLFYRTKVESHFKVVAAGFDQKLFQALSPPLMKLHIVRFDGCKTGDMVVLRLGIGNFLQEWRSEITYDNFSEEQFVFHDKGILLPPPLNFWLHQHIVRPSEGPDSGAIIIDDIEYRTGSKFLDVLIYPFIYTLFALRKPVYRKYFRKEQSG